MPPYQELLKDTGDWVDPQPGQRWLDLGCGSGRLSRMLWTKSAGKLAEIVAVDIAPKNAESFDKLRTSLQPAPGDKLQFLPVDFSNGLPWSGENLFDGVVSGLSIQYAESYSEAEQRWTDAAFEAILAEVYRVLKPGSTFVFSSIVPDPRWLSIASASLKGLWSSKRKLRYLLKLWGITSYGTWLVREAKRGRFHYLTHQVLTEKLARAGFVAIEYRLSYAEQAYIFRCRKP